MKRDGFIGKAEFPVWMFAYVPRLFKVRPLLDIVLPSFLRIYISSDYGKIIGFKQCEAAKWGLNNHRTLKWWKILFVTILDICLLNTTIVYNSIPTNSRLSGLEFRVKVIEGLLSTWKYNPAQHANQLSSSKPGPQVNIHTFLDAVARNGTVLYAVQSLREDKLV